MTWKPESSTNVHADWIEWRYEGVVEAPGGGLAETNFNVRTVWTAVDLQAAPVRLEPVTAATNEAGTIVNPAGVSVNGVAVLRVDAVPAGIVPDDAIHWSRSNDNVAFYAGHDTGREAYVRGVTAGDFTLEVSVDGFPGGYGPYIHGKVLEPTVTPIHVYIVCDASGNPAVSTNTVNAWVAEANRIYRQAAMSFTVAGVEYIYDHEEWFVVTTNFSQMCSYKNGTGGLELYCVSIIEGAYGLHSDRGLPFGDPGRGMAVAADANLNTLAHEIGHACGLAHVVTDGFSTEPVSEERVCSPNWSGGEGSGYHAPDLRYTALAERIIMSVTGGEARADIPLIGVSGLSGGVLFSLSAGIEQMSTRQPLH